MHFTTLALIALAGAPSILASPLLAERAVSASTSCTATVPQPTPQPLICGQEGRLRKKMGYLSSTPNDMAFSAEQCYQLCRTGTSNNTGCLTFAYNSKTSSCMFYTKPIKSQDFIVDQSTSEVFYNNRCWRNKCTTIKSTISAAPTSTTSKSSSVKTTKTSSVKSSSTKVSSTKPTSTKTTSTKATSTKATSTKATSTKASSTKASSTKASATPTTCPSNADLSIAACPTAKVNLLAGLNVLTYTNYFSGTGVTENPNNPGNLLNGLLIHNVYEFPSTITACDAVSQCAGQASILGLANLAQSFDLHLVGSPDGGCAAWECVTYGGPNIDDSQFNVKNTTIKAVFGYSGTLAGIGL